ncbi:MAG: YCF48-related protein [Crocinitomicaceae bacterium]|nr:YCF48-related protein [Crocinitomicaceae bacterium]
MKKTITIFAVFFTPLLNAQTWYEVSVPTEKDLVSIDFPTNLVGYIGGEDSLFMKTTDGGVTWTAIELTGVTMFGGGTTVQHIQFFNENLGYISTGPYGKVYKTEDGGTSWNVVEVSPDLCFSSGMYFFEEDSAIIGGAGCFSPERMDSYGPSGYNESAIPFTDDWYGLIIDIDFEGDLGIAVSNSNGIFRTTDHGVTWDTVHVGVAPGVPLTSVEIIDENDIYIGYSSLGEGSGILKSSDGGLTWGEEGASATFAYPAYLDVHETSDGTIYTGGQPIGGGGMILRFDGTSWNYSGVDEIINGLSSYDDNTTWGVGENGYVIVNKDPETLSSSTYSFDLEFEVFPNPSSEYISINFDSNVTDLVILIHDMTGKTVLETTEKDLIDVSNLNAGYYLVTMNNGTYSNSKQLFITK